MLAGNHFQQLLWYEVIKAVLLVTFLEYSDTSANEDNSFRNHTR